METIKSARVGGLPQPVFVPPPRGTTPNLAASPQRSAAASSVSVLGSKTICGRTPVISSHAAADRRYSAPAMARNSSHEAAIPVPASEADVGDAISEAFCDSGDFQGMRLILP